MAVGDINGDGRIDLITATGAGRAPEVKVFSGVDRSLLFSFFAYNPLFTGGVHAAVGDVNEDGRDDIITGAGAGGGPHLRVFSGLDLTELHSVYAYNPAFTGGLTVSAADVDGDGRADIITGAGAGGGPHVRAFSGLNLAELQSFYAYNPLFGGGVFVAGGRIIAAAGLQLVHDVPAAAATATELSTEDLALVSAAAMGRWQAAGLSAAGLDQLSRVRPAIADLPGARLGLAQDDLVLIDRDAAGRGWFVDSTPADDEEFSFVDAGRAISPGALERVLASAVRQRAT